MGRRHRQRMQQQHAAVEDEEHYDNVLATKQQAENADEEQAATTTAVPSATAHFAQEHHDAAESHDTKIGQDHHHYHHHAIPKRKFVYVITLLLALWMIQTSTSTSSIFQIVQQHEPSVRIFRSLLESVLVLLGTAVSVAVWRHCLGHDTTAQLLFQPPDHCDHSDHHHNNNTEKNSDADLFESAYDENDHNDSDDDNDNDVAILEDTSLRVPSPWWITSMALDLLIWILMALILYTITAVQAIVAMNDNDNNQVGPVLSRIAAPTFPLILFVVVLIRSLHPWRHHRSSVWQVLYRTWSAPMGPVTFRDGMIGDVLTSTVRPLQDIAFTIFYILFGLRGWYSQQYFFPNHNEDAVASQSERIFVTLQQEQVLMNGTTSSSFVDAADATVPIMERSWIVHTVVLPACMISPLWWRFLQNMRQVYDQQQRWPYLGNALKYFGAASVAMTGVYHPHLKTSTTWLTCFVVATLYQVCRFFVCNVIL